MLKFGLITLGCDKNTVDSERYLADLVAHGAEAVTDLRDAEVVVVNTCGFIDAAKKESIDAILEATRLKDDGTCRAVFAIGCMIERHKDELIDALPEVDVFLGPSETDRLVPELIERGLISSEILSHPGVRVFGGDAAHVRYLKVSEGCDHGCAFCAIPLMRGRHRSFALDDLIREAQLLELQGARELNLVAQDLAHYGRDRRDGAALPELLEALVRETDIPWIRNLYLYSAGITPRLLEVIAANPRIVRYLDTPMQHGADAVLARMRRPERQKTIRERLARYRDIVPDLAVRTTVIVGFPAKWRTTFPGALLRKNVYSKIMICFQYLIIITLIISAFFINKQTTFMQNYKMGFEQENLITFENALPKEKQRSFEEILRNIPGVEDVSLTCEHHWMEEITIVLLKKSNMASRFSG